MSLQVGTWGEGVCVGVHLRMDTRDQACDCVHGRVCNFWAWLVCEAAPLVIAQDGVGQATWAT